MSGLASLGIGSGLDANSLVERLVSAERAGPESRLTIRQRSIEASISAYGSLRSTLDELSSSLDGFADLAGGRTTSVSDKSVLEATAKDSAAVGTYSITVSDLADAHSVATPAYGATSDVVSAEGGTLRLSIGGGTTTDIAIEAGATVAGVRDAINAADAGVRAVILNDGAGERLVITSEKTGTAGAIDLSVVDGDGNDTDAAGLSALAFTTGAQNAEELVAADDADLVVNGLAVTRSSNSVDDLIEGVTLELATAAPASPVTVTVGADTRAATRAVGDFVEAFNGVVSQIAKSTKFDPESGVGSALTGDSLARGLLSDLRSTLLAEVGVEGIFDQLVELGITTGDGGTLEIDDDALDEAIETDFDGIAALLKGVGEQFAPVVARYTDDGGLFEAREDGLASRRELVDDQRVSLNRRISQLEARYRAEFGALDLLMSQLQATSTNLASALSSLPRFRPIGS